jgi:hypothetical protein
VFTPPYLTSGERPAIDEAPERIAYGEGEVAIASEDAARVEDAALVRVSSVTHSLNTDQRFVDLTTETDGDTVLVSAPGDARRTPPGPSMLFLIGEDGTPSVAEIVSVGSG